MASTMDSHLAWQSPGNATASVITLAAPTGCDHWLACLGLIEDRTHVVGPFKLPGIQEVADVLCTSRGVDTPRVPDRGILVYGGQPPRLWVDVEMGSAVRTPAGVFRWRCGNDPSYGSPVWRSASP